MLHQGGSKNLKVRFKLSPTVRTYMVSTMLVGRTRSYWDRILRKRVPLRLHSRSTEQIRKRKGYEQACNDAVRLARLKASDVRALVAKGGSLDWTLDSGSGRHLLGIKDALNMNLILTKPLET